MLTALPSGSFDPTRLGHPESLWLNILSKANSWSPAPGPLAVVSPHPDDEILGAGGLIHEWVQRGHAVTIISVTDGEAAYPYPDSLGSLRIHELQCALRRLSPTYVPSVRLGIPDGQVSRCRHRLRHALASLVTPGTTVVAPFEKDGHTDHDAIGEECVLLSKGMGLNLARYPIWRWHHGNAQEMRSRRWGRFPLTFAARRAKKHAIECFASQLTPAQANPIVPPHVLNYFERPFEAFIL